MIYKLTDFKPRRDVWGKETKKILGFPIPCFLNDKHFLLSLFFLLKILTSHSKEAVIAEGKEIIEILEEFRTWTSENFERTPVVFIGAKLDP